MLALDFDPVGLALAWLFAGSVIWMWRDPFTVTDAVLRGWLDRNGQLPPRGVLLAAHALKILLWPFVIDIGFKTSGFRGAVGVRGWCRVASQGRDDDGGCIIPSDVPAGRSACGDRQ